MAILRRHYAKRPELQWVYRGAYDLVKRVSGVDAGTLLAIWGFPIVKPGQRVRMDLAANMDEWAGTYLKYSEPLPRRCTPASNVTAWAEWYVRFIIRDCSSGGRLLTLL
jgi:hypothetical protein